MIKNKILTFVVDDEGIGMITINMEDHPANLFSEDFMKEYFDVTAKAIADENVKGVIVSSSRRMFMAGADLKMLQKPIEDAEAFFNNSMKLHQHMRHIETGGKPFVAAINGHALGGGLEVCLACHARIAVNNPKTKIGFPEVKVGLLPGGGGTAKAPYLMGLQNAMMYILQGIEANPAKAQRDGLLTSLVDTEDALIPAAKQWIKDNPTPVQPWDNSKHKIPGGGLFTPSGVQTMMGGAGNVSKLTHGNYPAAQYILSVIHDGIQVKIDRALEIEARYFTKAITSKEAKNMIRTGFFAIQEASKGKAKPAGYDPYEIKSIGMLGAGMMGAGIAYVSAKVGIHVVLKDVTLEGAEKGKDYSRALVKKGVSRKKVTQEKGDALLARITTTDDPSAIKDVDMIIEAVFENTDLKAKITAETEAVLGEDRIFGSNTSTIPITLLAKASKRPENFIGIHFFSPVDKMPLVEIIVGKETNDRAIAAAIDYVVKIRKVPIVVNDSRGFFTSRTFGTYCSEGVFMLEEGVPAAMIENVAKAKGMPVGPLAVTDEVSLTLGLLVYESDPTPVKPAASKRFYEMGKKLVNEYGREGKKNGKGFYDYPKGGKKRLWPELVKLFDSKVETLDKEIVGKRLLHRMALETFRCYEEGVLRTTKDGDIGSILGFGFPIYTGGALSYIDYVGAEQYVAECDEFTKLYGDRFAVSDTLRRLASSGQSIHDFKL
ncbi:MAG: 3-hydroxyacyl-CoA dehydrogenase/enoyl-CoA hydratase/3-hydroxybutyryl-CoA epimerase [Saprospiraceae bacterium]|jgi:3-hydroxyacyl-CoA dehydrogenase/enoyl-CoA hydratase/3-hydroxybutyryl-CoA epimerase